MLQITSVSLAKLVKVVLGKSITQSLMERFVMSIVNFYFRSHVFEIKVAYSSSYHVFAWFSINVVLFSLNFSRASASLTTLVVCHRFFT